MMVRFIATVCLVAFGTASLAEHSFPTQNRVDVIPVAGGFDVASGGGFGARGM